MRSFIRKIPQLLRIAAELLFFALFVAGFYGYAAWNPGKFQLIPALLRFFARTGMIGAAITISLILLSSLIFGRFYCAFFCPLGMIQDVMRLIVPRKSCAQRNFWYLRYPLCGAALVFGFFGNAFFFRLLDPYTTCGRIFSGGIFGIAAVLVLLVLVSWKKRIFCTAICPAGTLLGAAAKMSRFQLGFSDSCRHCNRCEQRCPAGCIDVGKQSLDNERCLRCMECVASCSFQGIVWKKTENSASVPMDEDRRFFIKAGAAFAGGAAAALVLKNSLKLTDDAEILPPGSWNTKSFISRCTGCTLCVQHCPQKIILPCRGRVRLDLSSGYCLDDCKRCIDVCPTGALRPLPLKIKQHTRLARAKFHPAFCLGVTSGEWCDVCSDACPRQALTLDDEGRPQLDRTRCIGCGRCRSVCPSPHKGWSMEPIDRQGVRYDS